MVAKREEFHSLPGPKKDRSDRPLRYGSAKNLIVALKT